MQRCTEVGTPALQRLRHSIRIVSRVKTHICKSLIGYAKPPVGEVGGNRQRHTSLVERLQNPYLIHNPFDFAGGGHATSTISPIKPSQGVRKGFGCEAA
jgi:hypothetical protein